MCGWRPWLGSQTRAHALTSSHSSGHRDAGDCVCFLCFLSLRPRTTSATHSCNVQPTHVPDTHLTRAPDITPDITPDTGTTQEVGIRWNSVASVEKSQGAAECPLCAVCAEYHVLAGVTGILAARAFRSEVAPPLDRWVF